MIIIFIILLSPFLVQLWTCANYHWYLKQSLNFNADCIADIQWDPEHAYTLHVLLNSGQYLQYTWSWVTHRSSGKSSDDNAYVAVIDGGMPLFLILAPCPPSLLVYYISKKMKNKLFFSKYFFMSAILNN